MPRRAQAGARLWSTAIKPSGLAWSGRGATLAASTRQISPSSPRQSMVSTLLAFAIAPDAVCSRDLTPQAYIAGIRKPRSAWCSATASNITASTQHFPDAAGSPEAGLCRSYLLLPAASSTTCTGQASAHGRAWRQKSAISPVFRCLFSAMSCRYRGHA